MKQMLYNNYYNISFIYLIPITLYLDIPITTVFHHLLNYLERLYNCTSIIITYRRKAMCGIPFYQLSAAIPATPSAIYNCILDGAMDIENSIPTSLQPFQTANGIQLSHPDNVSIVSKIGEELLLFSDYCQHRSSWRRRGYLVVVNELTRIFHTSFPHAQIEVCSFSTVFL